MEAPACIYAKDTSDIQITYDLLKKQENGFTVYLRKEIPAKWHYSKKEDRFSRIGDIYIIPNYPRVLSSWNGHINPGTHGYDPEIKDMQACFYAWGPQFRKGKKVDSFENIHVYPLVCRLLGLNYGKIDGNINVLRKLLK